MDDNSCYYLRWKFNFGSTKHLTRSHGQNRAYHLHSFSRIQQQHNGNTTRTLIFILLSAILLRWFFLSVIFCFQEELMWYIKKKNMNEWEHIILQEDKTETMANLGWKITIYSKITYHLTESAKTYDIICQISSLSKCRSDWYLLMNPCKQIRVHVN